MSVVRKQLHLQLARRQLWGLCFYSPWKCLWSHYQDKIALPAPHFQGECGSSMVQATSQLFEFGVQFLDKQDAFKAYGGTDCYIDFHRQITKEMTGRTPFKEEGMD